MELKEANRLFNDCWMLYKSFSQKRMNEDEIDEFIKVVDLMNKKYKHAFAKEMILAVINEIDRIMREKGVD